MTEIELIHPWTKERTRVEVIVITKTYISIRWGQSGIYDLNLLKNVLTARNVKARNRAWCMWTAVDIVGIREKVKVYLAKQNIKEIVADERARHDASMPNYVRKA